MDDWSRNAHWWALASFAVLLLAFGGASRADTIAQVAIRLVAVAAILWCVVQPARLNRHPGDWRPFIFFGLVAALLLLQLVPLPPSLWAVLPGHARLAEWLTQAGLPIGWRPLSLTPDLTLNSLLSLLPVLAMLMLLQTAERPQTGALLPVMLIGIAISALLGLIQVASGNLYFYAVTNLGQPVGVFANRNHAAIFLALAFPLLACWGAMPNRAGSNRLRAWVALCAAALVLPMLMVAGSRAGLLAGGIGAIAAIAILAREGKLLPSRNGRGGGITLFKILPLAIGTLAIAATIFLSRDLALTRLMSQDGGERATFFPQLIQIVRDFFPLGAGFGSFDPVFRIYEPFGTLDSTYFNHAHNDLFEILIEGGVPALALLLAFVGWFVLASYRVWRERSGSQTLTLARTGSALILILLLTSLADYPLRTPLLAGVLVTASIWLRLGLGSLRRADGAQ